VGWNQSTKKISLTYSAGQTLTVWLFLDYNTSKALKSGKKKLKTTALDNLTDG